MARTLCVGLVFLFNLSIAHPQEETARNTKSLSTQQLVDCLTTKLPCKVVRAEVEGELVRRKAIDLLTQTYRQTHDPTARGAITETLYDIDEPRVEEFMRSIQFDSKDDWYPKNYLAERGDRTALAFLGQVCQYPIPPYIWAKSLEQFGKYGYRPAIPCLIWWVSAGSSHAADAAYESLQQLYPHSPKNLDSPEAVRMYFQKRYDEERTLVPGKPDGTAAPSTPDPKSPR